MVLEVEEVLEFVLGIETISESVLDFLNYNYNSCFYLIIYVLRHFLFQILLKSFYFLNF